MKSFYGHNIMLYKKEIIYRIYDADTFLVYARKNIKRRNSGPSKILYTVQWPSYEDYLYTTWRPSYFK